MLIICGTAVPVTGQLQDHGRETYTRDALGTRTAERLAAAMSTPAPVSARVRANKADSLILVEFYKSTFGRVWNNNEHWLSGSLSDWHGVTLNETGRVSGLVLRDNGLLGSLPENLSGLPDLEVLSLPLNSLAGPLSAAYGNASSLKQLILWGNRLSGAIPVALANLEQLEDLLLFRNLFDGIIPPELGRMQNLRRLWLDYNQLTGSIPVDLTELGMLEELFVDGNRLTGMLPAGLDKLRSVKSFYAGGNKLTGPLPDALWRMPALENLQLSRNQHIGELSGDIAHAPRLVSVLLSGNHLSGSIPEDLFRLPELIRLFLSDNQLEGLIPESLGGARNLQYLDLSHNNLTGHIPDELAEGTYLKMLDLSHNELEGTLPPSFARLSVLSDLNLSYNELGGDLASLEGLQRLRRMRARGNQFSGPLPASFRFIPALDTLDLGNNAFTGTLEEFFSRRTALVFLAVDSNAVNGVVPETIRLSTRLRTLLLHHNNIEELPALPMLDSLNVSGNRLTFEDLEHNLPDVHGSFQYADQDSISLSVEAAETTTRLKAIVGGSANEYRWYRDGVVISDQSQPTLTVERTADGPSYHCEVTNLLVQGLTLVSRAESADAVSTARRELARDDEMAVSDNYPNPFIGTTSFNVESFQPVHVRLVVYDILGRRIGVYVDRDIGAGEHRIDIRLGALSPGKYWYLLETGATSASGIMTLVR